MISILQLYIEKLSELRGGVERVVRCITITTPQEQAFWLTLVFLTLYRNTLLSNQVAEFPNVSYYHFFQPLLASKKFV